jgi:acetyl esterase
MALPPSAQRLLAGGGRVRRDGQVLDPSAQLTLRLLALKGGSPIETASPEVARRDARLKAVAVAGPPLPMATVTERTVPGADGPLPARLYVPEGAATPSPLLVYLHGGGWVIGDLDTHDPVCRFLAREARVRVLSVAYRLAPEHPFPAAVDDALAAWRGAVAAAGSVGADPARVAIGGDSAGGTLAAVTCLALRDAGEPLPAFQLLIYPGTDMAARTRSYDLFGEGFYLTEAEMDWFKDQYLPDPADRVDWRASPLRAKDLRGLPPAWVATAGFDPLRDEGEAYAQRLVDAGVRVAPRRFPGLIHGFANTAPRVRSAAAALREGATLLATALAR